MSEQTDNRVALITGPTAGLGKGIALELAKKGYRLVLLARNGDKLGQLEKECLDMGAEAVQAIVCNMNSQASVRSAAEQFLQSGWPLQVLVNNAGMVNRKHKLTEDELEETMAVAYWSAFLLTMLLLPRMIDSAPGTIINTASDTYPNGVVPYDDPKWTKKYRMLGPYAAAKKANVMLSLRLAEALKPEQISVNAYNPGPIYTDIVSSQKSFFTPLVNWIWSKVAKPVSVGIQAPVLLATADNLAEVTSRFYNYNKETPVKPEIVEESKGPKLWAMSQQFTDRPAPEFLVARMIDQ